MTYRDIKQKFKVRNNMKNLKDYLKLGRMVEFRNGYTSLVIEHQGKQVCVGEFGFCFIDDAYSADLKCEVNPDYDIMCIYDVLISSFDTMLNPEIKTKVWERKQEIKELTIREIAEKFNVSPESIRIKDE